MGVDSRQNQYAQRKTAKQAEAGPIPPVADSRRRKRYAKSLDKFLRYYMPNLFSRPFSDDQLDAIGKIEQALTNGGQFAEAMPRGAGKTTIIQGSMIWASLYGHRRYLVVVGSDQRAADAIIRDIKAELETNDRLLEDFPEVCVPVRHIDGRGQRCNTQTVDGVRTHIGWKQNQLVFPAIEGSPSSGTAIEGRGITSGVRGMKRGDKRPDFVLLDDPQTRESADSASQTQGREQIILGDVMGLAGHDRKISAVMCCTVIRKGDLSDRFLDREKRPEWQGHRTPLVYSWGDAEDLWAKYHEIWKEGQRQGEGTDAATAYYRKNRKKMDAGARVTCKHMYDRHNEESAIQHAYNLLYTVGEQAFAAEYQNDPQEAMESLYDITPELVASRVNGMPRWSVPENAGMVTGFADINYLGLHWSVCGWQNDFTGYVASYGKHPGGKDVLFDPKSGQNRDAAIYQGLTDLMDRVASAEIIRNDTPSGLDLFMIDCGAGWMDTVFQWVRFNSRKYPFKIMPSRGWGSGRYRQTKVIGRAGEGWHQTEFSGKGRVVSHDADLWRMRAQKAFLLEVGSPGSLSIFGENSKKHTGFADQMCGEKLVDYAETDKGVMYRWEYVVGRRNDLLDAVVGCMVGAAACGASSVPTPSRKRKKVRRRPRVRQIKI